MAKETPAPIMNSNSPNQMTGAAEQRWLHPVWQSVAIQSASSIEPFRFLPLTLAPGSSKVPRPGDLD